MATTGRGMGRRGSYEPVYEQHFTPGGMVYWTRADDPGWGYLYDPDAAGLVPDATRRYPIEYINYVWGVNPTTDGRNSRETAVGQQRRELTASAFQGRICVPYGRVRIGGNLMAWAASGSILYMSEAVCHGPIEGFVGIRILDQDASLVAGAPFHSDAQFQTELGLASPAGSPPSYYTAATFSAVVERHPYLATAHARYNLAGTRGIREAPSALYTIDGRTLRDPRLGVDADGVPDEPEAFSSNVALALADYYTSTIYGLGVPDDRINWDSVGDAADYCDTLVGGLPRHTINWAIMRPSTHRAIIETIKGLANLVVIRRDGKRVFIPETTASRVHVFTPANSQPAEVEKVSLATAPNIVKVTFTNPAKDWGDDSVTAMTEAARTGAEPPFPEDFVFEGLNNASEAQRQADWLLADLRNPLRASWSGTKAESEQFEPMDMVGYYSPTASLGVSEADPQDLRIVKVQRRADGTVRFTGKLYSADYFSDATRTTETPPVNTTPPPTEPPDPPESPAAASTLTVGDGLSVQSNGGLITVTWSHPGWPYDLRYRVTAEPAGGSETVIADVPSGPVFINGATLPVTVRVYAYVLSTGATSTALAGTHYAVTTVPEVTGFYLDMFTDNPAILYFDPPYERIETQHGTAFWSNGAGLTAFDGTLVNNGSTAAAAFTNALTVRPTVQWSDTAATGPWTSPNPQNHITRIGDGTAYWFRQWAATGHRWWSLSWGSGSQRLVFDAGAGNTKAFREYKVYRNGSNQVTEVQFIEYGAEVTGIAGYRIYRLALDGSIDEIGLAMPQIPAHSRPTSSNPLVVEQFGQRTSSEWATAGFVGFHLRVAVVLANGTESTGVVHLLLSETSAAGGAAPYVPQIQTSLALSNGVNSDIGTAAGPGAQFITGPTAAFTLGGFGAPLSGAPWLPIVYTGAQICTISNANASSSAANRIKTFTGGDIVARGAFEALFRYDPTDTLWHLVAFNDGTIRYSGGNVGIGGQPSGYAGRLIHVFGGEATYPQVAIERAGAGTWTNRKWMLLIGSAGEFWVQDVTGARNAINISTAGIVGFSDGIKIGSGATVSGILSGSKTWDPASIAGGSYVSTTVTVTGAAAGDKVLCSLTTITDGSVTLTGQVLAANTVTVTLANCDPTNAINLGSGTLSALVFKHT